MKRCPKCSRTFPDESQKFCTFDGGLLRADQPAFDPNLTVRATSKDLIETPPPPTEVDASEAKTSVRLTSLNETITSFGTSTFGETTPVGSQTSSDLTPPPPPSESAPTSADLSAHAPAMAAAHNLSLADATTLEAPVIVPAETAPAAAPAPAAPPKKRSVLPWVLAGLVLLLLLGGGAAVAGYFLVVKPMMEAKNGPIDSAPNTNTNTNSNSAPSPADTSTPANANTTVETKKEPEPFTPTADAVQFENSAANLDGDLAAHYVGFSFYYPKAWIKDPKSGIPGASNFAQVYRQDESGEYQPERVIFNWYPSKGSYEADASVFPDSAKKISAQLAKNFPNYEEVSQGDTTVTTYKGYEVRFKGIYKGTSKGDLPYWGRVIFLPPGSKDQKGGVAIIMIASSLSNDVTSAADIGDKGGMALILESLRFKSE